MARMKLIETPLPDKHIHVVKNAETFVIPTGTPLVLNLSGTKQPSTDQNGRTAGFEDGLQVVVPNSAGAGPTIAYAYGIAAGPIQPSQLGESVLHGVVSAVVLYATRAASTDSWSSSASIAASQWLNINTVNNAFSTMVSGSATSDDKRAFAGIMADSVASFAASASNTSDTRTALTALKRVFVRMM